jgi:hypothetical protein
MATFHRLRSSVLAMAIGLPAAVGPLSGCTGNLEAPRSGERVRAYAPGPVVLPRLTEAQYRASVESALGGSDLEGAAPLPRLPLEEDTNPYLFYSVGAASTTLSEVGTQRYEESAHALARAVVDDPVRRDAVLGCAPTAPGDACAAGAIERVGRLLYRRPLEADERARWVGVATDLAAGDALRGLRFALAGMLQSPSFLYRVELGQEDASRPGWRRYTDLELASRMAFVLWNTAPDAALLDAAESGRLATADGVRAEALRMLEDPRARRAVRAFFAQYFDLARLGDVRERDPELHPMFSATLPAAMRTEMELVIDDVVFTRDADVRELLRTRRTFVNEELAALYDLDVEGATPITFVPVELPADGPRAGILTLGAFLTMNAHPTETSPTLRGKYVRERLLCDLVPPPPPGVATDIPPPAGMPRTLRERLVEHRARPDCAACHDSIDPPGFLFEGFDAIGRVRATDHGYPVDTSGGLDGTPLANGRELGELLADDPRVSLCIARQLFRHANGRLERDGEETAIRQLARDFLAGGSRFLDLLLGLVTSESFRWAAPSDEGARGAGGEP